MCSLFRPQYYKIIEECVSQIVLHCSGMDPDFKCRGRMDVDFTHLVGSYPRRPFFVLKFVFLFSMCVFSEKTCTCGEEKARSNSAAFNKSDAPFPNSS